MTNTAGRTSQLGLLSTYQKLGSSRASQVGVLASYAPPQSHLTEVGQVGVLAAKSGGATNVTAKVSEVGILMAYYTGQPGVNRQNAWTFIMDGHRFYVLPLGPEGDWAYDTTTQEWCQLQTQGFDGLNFTHGVMWGLRVMGGDSLYSYLYELDPTQPLDEGFRTVEHIVTGGIPTRTRNSIGVSNFSLTASVGDDQAMNQTISLAFSDDNGVTYSDEFAMPLTDMGSQLLIWNALGSFAQPGRIFRVTDYAGPVRLDGADCVLVEAEGTDSGQAEEGHPRR